MGATNARRPKKLRRTGIEPVDVPPFLSPVGGAEGAPVGRLPFFLAPGAALLFSPGAALGLAPGGGGFAYPLPPGQTRGKPLG